jgi:hypothetical protein
VTSRERAAFALAARWLRKERLSMVAYPLWQIGFATYVADSMLGGKWAPAEECAAIAESLSLDGMDIRRVP